MNNSELRKDIVSGDWIVIAPQRSKRPHDLIKKPQKRKKASIKGCPFENPQKTTHGEPILVYPNKKNWQIQIVQNKYPVFVPGEDSKVGVHICASAFQKGPYWVIDGKGYHDLVITKDHHKNFAHLPKKQAEMVFKLFQDRYKMFLNDSCLAYTSIFHNWGPKAGASIYHPHYQIITLPVVPPDVEHSLRGSAQYFQRHKKCVHCTMIDWEKKSRSRIVYENKGAIAFTPFVSMEPFELRISLKKHSPFFENVSQESLKWIVEALQKVLIIIEKRLNDPDYNFFIHTAPLSNKNKHRHYHWHIEVLPKISVSAGFELGTGIEITVIDPDVAAGILKK
ncbi:MAG: HIT domain-containing protein [Candidatus Paceibacterota bacterium]